MLLTVTVHAQVSFINQSKPGNEQPVVITPYNWRYITIGDVIQKTKVYFYVYNNNMHWVVVLPKCTENIPEDFFPDENNFLTSFVLKKGESVIKKTELTDISNQKDRIMWSLPISYDRDDYETFTIVGVDSNGKEYILYTD